jgi:hypothetical protein
VIHHGAWAVPGPEKTASSVFPQHSQSIPLDHWHNEVRFGGRSRPDNTSSATGFYGLGDTASCGNAGRQDHSTDVALAAYERALEPKRHTLIPGGPLPYLVISNGGAVATDRSA